MFVKLNYTEPLLRIYGDYYIRLLTCNLRQIFLIKIKSEGLQNKKRQKIKHLFGSKI